MNQRLTLLAGVLFCGLAVALGAFGAHALKPMLLANNKVETFELAVRYQMYHGFALLFLALWMQYLPGPGRGIVALLWTIGVLFFSGSLYAMSFALGHVFVYFTPAGGVLFLAGWIRLLWAVIKTRS